MSQADSPQSPAEGYTQPPESAEAIDQTAGDHGIQIGQARDVYIGQLPPGEAEPPSALPGPAHLIPSLLVSLLAGGMIYYGMTTLWSFTWLQSLLIALAVFLLILALALQLGTMSQGIRRRTLLRALPVAASALGVLLILLGLLVAPALLPVMPTPTAFMPTPTPTPSQSAAVPTPSATLTPGAVTGSPISPPTYTPSPTPVPIHEKPTPPPTSTPRPRFGPISFCTEEQFDYALHRCQTAQSEFAGNITRVLASWTYSDLYQNMYSSYVWYYREIGLRSRQIIIWDGVAWRIDLGADYVGVHPQTFGSVYFEEPYLWRGTYTLELYIGATLEQSATFKIK